MAHDRKFRFGVQVGTTGSATEWRDMVRKIEDLGYSTVYVPDHFVNTQLAPLPAISFAAAHTTELRVGMLVLGNDYKHPAVVAKEAATIDLLSNGRLEFGLGAGWMQSDYDALGFPYDRAGVRVDRLEEALAVVNGSWSGTPFDFAGEHYTITDYTGLPEPVQQPRPPIVIGGGAPRVLRLAGREADIVGINPNLRAGEVTTEAAQTCSAELTRQKVDWIKEGAGDRYDDLELQIRYFFGAITDDARGLAESIAPSFGITADGALESGVALMGSVDSVCETLQQRREAWDVSYIVLGDDTYEAFAPVVARLTDT